jgi:hypothetical protein
MQPNSPEFPLESPPISNLISDGYIAALKVGLSIIMPGVGPAVAESLGTIVGYRSKVALENWLSKLHERMLDLGDRVTTLESSEKANEVCSIVISAGQAVVKCHQAEKLEALQAAVLNTAISPMENADERAVFVRYIDELTPTHLRMLRIISDNPSGFSNISEYISVFKILRHHGMNLPTNDDCFLYFRELISRDLIRTHPKLESGDRNDDRFIPPVVLTMKDIDAPSRSTMWRAVSLSPTGERFIRFITQPPL